MADYVDMQEVTAENLNLLVERIEVFDRCRTDFADIQNKKECEVTDNGKNDF